MLKKAGQLWLAAISLLGLTIFLEGVIPRDTFGDMIPELGLIHSMLEHIFKFLTGVLIFSVIDKVLLPDLDITDLLLGEGHWGRIGQDFARAAAILVWGMIFAVVLYSFMVVL